MVVFLAFLYSILLSNVGLTLAEILAEILAVMKIIQIVTIMEPALIKIQEIFFEALEKTYLRILSNVMILFDE